MQNINNLQHCLTIVLIIIFITRLNGEISLANFIPYGLENGDANLRPSNLDDGSSEKLNISIGFPFFDNLHDSLWVNINGAISLRSAISTYTPICTAVSQDFSMIAPYWSDADLNNGGNIYYRETFDSSIIANLSDDIRTAFPEFKSLGLSWAFVSTWSNVSYYTGNKGCSSLTRNTFQSVLVSNGIYSFAIFYYNEINWTTGTASGGNCSGLEGDAAKAGFDAGDGKSLYMIDGSCTGDIITINQRSNIGTPGKWVFRVDNADIRSPGCKNEFNSNVKVVPALIDLFGYVPIHITGPCFNDTTEVVCRFHDTLKDIIEVSGRVVETKVNPSVECIAPFLYSTGRIIIDVVLTEENNSTKIYSGFIYVIQPQDNSDNRVELIVNELSDNRIQISFIWNTSNFDQNQALDINLYTYNKTLIEWQINKQFANNVHNNGNITKIFSTNYFPEIFFQTASTISVEPQKNESYLLSRYKRGLLINNLIEIPIKIFSRFTLLYRIYRALRIAKRVGCETFLLLGDAPKTDLQPCPPTAALAERDNSFEADKACLKPPCYFHPGADFCIRSRNPSTSGGGQQCCYRGGNILMGPPGGGTADNYSPNKGYFSHFWSDVLPWILCCLDENDKLCRKYYNKRPSDAGTNYVPPIPAGGKGDPHITTFDHLEYTFNGYGEFWMIKNSDVMPMQLQARMEPFIQPNRTISRATVFTAFAMKSDNSSTVKVQKSSIRTVDIFVDGITVDLSNPLFFDMNYNGVQVSVDSDLSSVTVSFVCGFDFHVMTNSEAFSIFTTCDDKYRNKTRGLLGVFDGNKENDLQDQNGNIIAINSTLQEIHYKFGLKWNILESESLFTYSGKHFSDYNNISFLPNFETPDLETVPQEAKDICGDSVNCLYDYITTGSATVANFTKKFDEIFNETVEIYHTEVIVCQPLSNPNNGYYQTNNFLSGSIATYNCNDNYLLNGGINNLCKQNGEWNSSAPTCVQKSVLIDPTTIQTHTDEPHIQITVSTTLKHIVNPIVNTVKPSTASTVRTTLVPTNDTNDNQTATTTSKPNSSLLNGCNRIIIIVLLFKIFFL